jgi:hypothetical protein
MQLLRLNISEHETLCGSPSYELGRSCRLQFADGSPATSDLPISREFYREATIRNTEPSVWFNNEP